MEVVLKRTRAVVACDEGAKTQETWEVLNESANCKLPTPEFHSEAEARAWLALNQGRVKWVWLA